MDDDKEEIKCFDCGTTKDVTQTICPFADEIYDDQIKMTLCSDCYHERCMEI